MKKISQLILNPFCSYPTVTVKHFRTLTLSDSIKYAIEVLLHFALKRVSMGLSVWRETSKKLTVCREKGKKLTVCRELFLFR